MMRRLIMRNSIEPSQTGNCTNFEDTLCEPSGLLNFALKHKQQIPNDSYNAPELHDMAEERLLIHIDDELPNVLKDNILYYSAGFLVQKLLPKIHCKRCRNELLLNPSDPTALTVESSNLCKIHCMETAGWTLTPISCHTENDKGNRVFKSHR